MKYSQMFSVMQEAELSSETLGSRMGISGMTLRRWRKESGNRELPRLYSRALEEVICELATEGKLKRESPMVQTAIAQSRRASFATIAAHLGIRPEQVTTGQFSEQMMIDSLSQIGKTVERQDEVEQNTVKISSFKSWGEEWRQRISSLMRVLKSKELHAFDKFVAYGALFYLVTPIDLIPDQIPVFGFMDDFVILGFAAAYYAKRFPNLLSNPHE
jgi:uncharacterized membrane protein YkvA (DUF1232 family)